MSSILIQNYHKQTTLSVRSNFILIGLLSVEYTKLGNIGLRGQNENSIKITINMNFPIKTKIIVGSHVSSVLIVISLSRMNLV